MGRERMQVAEALKDVSRLSRWVGEGGDLPLRLREAIAGRPGGIPGSSGGGKLFAVLSSLALIFLLALAAGVYLLGLAAGGRWELFWWSLPALFFGLPPLSFLGILGLSRLRGYRKRRQRSRFIGELENNPYLLSALHLLEAHRGLEDSRDRVRENLKDLDGQLERLRTRREGTPGEEARNVIAAYRAASQRASRERSRHLEQVEAHLEETGRRLADQWSLALTAFEHGLLVEGSAAGRTEALAQAEETVARAEGLTKVSLDLVHTDLGLDKVDDEGNLSPPPGAKEKISPAG